MLIYKVSEQFFYLIKQYFLFSPKNLVIANLNASATILLPILISLFT